MGSVQNYGLFVIILLVTVFASSSFTVCFSFSDDIELVETEGEENSDKNSVLEVEKDSEEILIDVHNNLNNSIFAVALPIYMNVNYPVLYPESTKPPPENV